MFIASPSRRVYLPSVGAKDTVDHCRANSHRRKWRAFLFPEWVPCSVGRSPEGTVMWQANTKVYIYTVYIWRIWSQQDGSICNRILSLTNNRRPQNLGHKKNTAGPPGACRWLVPDIAGSSATTTRASCSPRAIVVRLVQLKKPCHRNVDVVSHPFRQLHLDPGRQGVGGLPSYVYNSQGLS